MASRAEGLLALAKGDAEGARLALEDAVDLFAREEAPYETGRTRVMLGRALATLGDKERAREEWGRALEVFRSLGAGLDAARASDLLERGGVRDSGRGPAALGLTDREIEIVRLVASGLSNQEIARTLVLSVRTVERHISNVYDKFGVAGRSARSAIIARAFQLGLLPAR